MRFLQREPHGDRIRRGAHLGTSVTHLCGRGVAALVKAEVCAERRKISGVESNRRES